MEKVFSLRPLRQTGTEQRQSAAAVLVHVQTVRSRGRLFLSDAKQYYRVKKLKIVFSTLLY